MFVSTSNGFLEKRRADTGAAVWAVADGSAGTGAEGTSTSSPAIVTPTGSTQTQVVIGSLDGHVYSFDARTGAQLWQYPTFPTDYIPVNTSPTVTPGGYVLVTMGEQTGHNFACHGIAGCWGSAQWAVLRIDPHDGTTNGGWGLGTGTVFTDTSGNPVAGTALYGASAASYDPATGMVFAGEPDTLIIPGNPVDTTSGVLALYAPDNGGFSFAWEQRWDTGGTGIPATPAVSGGLVFAASTNSLRSFDENAGTPLATASGAHSIFSSPAVAGGTVFVGTDNGYMRAYTASGLALTWTSAQALDGSGNPVSYAAPVVVGQNDNKGVVPYVVFNTNGNGDVKAFNAAGSGTNAAIATVNDHGTGKGGVAVSGGVVYVQGTDGQLRAFGI